MMSVGKMCGVTGGRWKNALYIGGILLAGHNQSTWRATCLCANVSSTRTIWTGLEWNPGLYSERLATNHQNQGMTYPLADQKSDILGINILHLWH